MTWSICSAWQKYQLNHSMNGKVYASLRGAALKSFYNFFHDKPAIVLGIESSCDDTGCGIVDSNGNILGEAINSQQLVHLKHGGIIPTIARDMHKSSITATCEDALRSANLRLKDIDAIAATVKPGLPMSLQVGTDFGKYLSKIGAKPFIPIHHMEAHALTARLSEKVDFPYLVLLISGGHCLLAIVNDVDTFNLLGTVLDNAPGEILDKIARRLKLRNIPEFNNLSGGLALELAARRATDVNQFFFTPIMTSYYNCHFSFSGIMNQCLSYVLREEGRHNITGDMTIPDVYNLSAGIQLAMIIHVCQRTQRAMEYIEKMSLFPKDKQTLVVSGGVACNDLLAKALATLSSELGYKFVRTPPKLCTDNGVMIAWNGVERWLVNKGVIRDQGAMKNVIVEKKAPLGNDWSKKVEDERLKCKWVQVKKELI